MTTINLQCNSPSQMHSSVYFRRWRWRASEDALIDLYARYISTCGATCTKETMDSRMALLPVELCDRTVTFKEFYLFVRSEFIC